MYEQLLKRAATELLKPPTQLIKNLGRIASEMVYFAGQPSMDENEVRRQLGEFDPFEAPAAPSNPELAFVVTLPDGSLLRLHEDNAAVLTFDDEPELNHVLVTHYPKDDEELVWGFFNNPELMEQLEDDGFKVFHCKTARPCDRARYVDWSRANLADFEVGALFPDTEVI